MRYLLAICFFVSITSVFAQQATVKGKLTDQEGAPVQYADIYADSTWVGFSNGLGNYEVTVPAGKIIVLRISHVNHDDFTKELNLNPGEVYPLDQELVIRTGITEDIVIDDRKTEIGRREAGRINLNPKHLKKFPSPFGDITSVLITLPGVASNSELSSDYRVRGGNFDENLIYVNDIQVYRPFLIRTGQQDGLSFVNPDMVEELEFYAGGWQPRFGDKLSSVLNIQYKDPDDFGGSVSLGLLGGTGHLEGTMANKRISYVIGARQKSSRYLLNTLQTKGEYLPKFIDIQSYITFDLTKRKDSTDTEKRTTLGLLTSYARNRYLVQPATRETNFGTVDQVLKLTVGFDGQEILQYDTWQGGLKFSHEFSDRYKADFVVSMMHSREREFFDIEAGYRLCDVDPDPDSDNFNKCITTTGLGTLFDHGRNRLQATVVATSHRSYYEVSDNSKIEFGYYVSGEVINDELDEYSFIDSADYVQINHSLHSKFDLESIRPSVYAQHSLRFDSLRSLTYGARLSYWTVNQQFLISPRIQYSWKPKNAKRDIVYKTALGVYQQPAFYREMRRPDGSVNTDLKAQSSIQLIGGLDYNFKAWDRDFKFLAEVYGKYLYNVVPYDIKDVKIRYFGENAANAYVVGADFRVSGEFINGGESWFSLGILSAREDVKGDGNGFIRRPSDQRINLGIYFQDHLPNQPTWKMFLNLIYSTGLPFGPPENLEFRNSFNGPAYRRVDIGFSKLIALTEQSKVVQSVWIGVEVLNLLGVSNKISYIWIEDFSGRQFAVPNALSQRFLNVRAIVKF